VAYMDDDDSMAVSLFRDDGGEEYEISGEDVQNVEFVMSPYEYCEHIFPRFCEEIDQGRNIERDLDLTAFGYENENYPYCGVTFF